MAGSVEKSRLSAIFHPNEDGTFTITYLDLPGCISEGKSLGNAVYMAQAALKEKLNIK